jgi:hypothetical protein
MNFSFGDVTNTSACPSSLRFSGSLSLYVILFDRAKFGLDSELDIDPADPDVYSRLNVGSGKRGFSVKAYFLDSQANAHVWISKVSFVELCKR